MAAVFFKDEVLARSLFARMLDAYLAHRIAKVTRQTAAKQWETMNTKEGLIAALIVTWIMPAVVCFILGTFLGLTTHQMMEWNGFVSYLIGCTCLLFGAFLGIVHVVAVVLAIAARRYVTVH